MSRIAINWAAFSKALEQQVLAAQLANQKVALLLVQVSHLFAHNFRLGFDGGESIALEVMNRLEASVRRAAILERISPDTFAVVVYGIEAPELLPISARKMVEQLSQPFEVNGESIHLKATVGVAMYPDHGQQAEALVSEADLALRFAADNASDFHIPYRPRMDKHISMVQMGVDLRTAIAEEYLALHYQPKVDLRTLKPVAAEALMRWTLPDGTRVTPDQFIPVAEASGILRQLTDWAINTALREGEELFAEGGHSVAVNMSASSIYDPSMVSTVESALAIWGLPAENFTLEVTESTLMKDPELCFKHLSMIRDMGVKIAIDDFGTGFSSLSYFKAIPADEIKIDQSFVKTMCESDDDRKIVALIVDLSHKFGLKVVAEGIQSKAILQALQSMGCDVGQGFYLGKPMPLDVYQRWLQRVTGP